MRPTVHDLAQSAGVSLATVDRVLNNRPGVKASTRSRVEEAIARIGFVRDVAAANLAKGRIYPLTFVVPSGDNSFMVSLRHQIEEAKTRSIAERTEIVMVEVPAFDAEALVAALRALRNDPPAGVAVVAVDTEEVRRELLALKASGVAIVTLVSDLEGFDRDHFAGVDNLAAGRTAGSLMARFLAGKTGRIGVIAGSMLVRDHQDRLIGFRERLAEINPSLVILPAEECHDDPHRVDAAARRLLAEAEGLVGIYNLGAGNRGLIAALSLMPSGPRPVAIAHELTDHTRAALEGGVIDVILNQDAGHEVRAAIRVMKAKSDGTPVIAAQERIRIDIFLKDNLP
ncbi:LacI family DNA-binding transcriptional regulator [Rhizobium alvei]|uniref:LacI family DNA-binding transcriptional regulator n=1 Tax=Rhizobium alvei TaxID=1132659 RepID=A0ABT8YPH9_9HYPH|nr:LacI family DNA-binding transcriptional regulator [Rhizobium alvei]MDO6965421.1 LacI family DNA-binding transcriptional regulator [Rhizobium alvei]